MQNLDDIKFKLILLSSTLNSFFHFVCDLLFDSFMKKRVLKAH